MKRMISASSNYFQALNNQDKDGFLSCFAPEAALNDPYGGRPYLGSEGLNKWFDGFTKTWQEFVIQAGEPYISGDRLAVSWDARGTAHTGKEAKFEGIDVFTIDDSGQIVRMDGYWDAQSMLAQIR